MRAAPAQPVTFDVNVFVAAVAGGPHAFWAWPSPPPLIGNLSANCLGIVNDAEEFSLWLSPHVMTNVLRVLATLDWSRDRALDYVQILKEIADSSGGGVVEPGSHVDDCPDYEDNRIPGARPGQRVYADRVGRWRPPHDVAMARHSDHSAL